MIIESTFGIVYIVLRISCALTKDHVERKCSQPAVNLCTYKLCIHVNGVVHARMCMYAFDAADESHRRKPQNEALCSFSPVQWNNDT